MFTTKMMMTAAFAIATIGAPALAQSTTSTPVPRSNDGKPTGEGATMTTPETAPAAGTPAMTKSQMATMKRCQKMTPAKMAKNKSCMKMQEMHGGMTPSM